LLLGQELMLDFNFPGLLFIKVDVDPLLSELEIFDTLGLECAAAKKIVVEKILVPGEKLNRILWR
jgi:hypothetical protein